jgi:hypothetical protein
MPCGSRARVTAYIAYNALQFAERDVLLASLVNAGYRVEMAPAETEASNPLPVLDAARRIAGKAALVLRRQQLPAGFGDLGFALRDGAYIPMLPAGRRSELLLQDLRAAYGRAKADQLAEMARQRYQGTVHRSVAADGCVTIRVRF